MWKIEKEKQPDLGAFLKKQIHTEKERKKTYIYKGFPGGSDGKESTCNAGDPGSVLGLGKSPGEGNGNSLQYSCLENSTDRRA